MMAVVRRYRSNKNPIRDLARYFMSSSWGVKNCSCNDCCDRSGNCCWEECSYIEMTLTDWYRCYYTTNGLCDTPVQNAALADEVFRPPLDPETNAPVTEFRLYPAPGGNTNRGMGCEIGAGARQGQVWRTLYSYDFRQWNYTPGLPAACPPPTWSLAKHYLYVQYLSIADGGLRWDWWISPSPVSRFAAGSSITKPNGTEYRCCGVDWDRTTACAEIAPYTWARDFQYASIRPKGVTCCRDTTDSAHHPDCGLNVDGKDPALCPCINGGWGWDLTDPDEPNCCASCERDDCIDLPL